MAGHWYCNFGGQVAGPYPAEQLRQMAGQGQLGPQTPVSQTPQGPWLVASQIAGLFAAAAPARPAVPVAQAAPAPVAPAPVAPAPVAPAPVAPAPAAATPAAQAAAPVARAAVPTAAPVTPVARAMPVAANPAPPRPAAVPMGRTAVPTAQPMAPRPAAPPTGPPPPKASSKPAVMAPSSAGGTSQLLADRAARRSGSKNTQYALIAIAVIGMFAGAGLIFAVISMQSERTDADQEVAQQPDADMLPPAVAPDAGGADAAGALATGELSVDEQKQIMASLYKWKDVTKIKAAGLPNVARVSIADAWVSSNSKGTTRDTVLHLRSMPGPRTLLAANAERGAFTDDVSRDDEGSSDAADDVDSSPEEADASADSEDPAGPESDATETPPEPASTPSRYVFIKISISSSNPSESVQYNSWNGTGANPRETRAILADSSGKICELVPYAQSSVAGRKSTVSIAPSQEITDIVVFRVPGGPFEYLRLALPYASLGVTNAKPPYACFEIPRSRLNRPPSDKLAGRGSDKRGDLAAPGTGPVDPDNPGVDPILRGIKEGLGGDQEAGGAGDGRPNRFDGQGGDDGGAGGGDNPFAGGANAGENPFSKDAGGGDDEGGDDDSPFPKPDSVGGDDDSPFPKADSVGGDDWGPQPDEDVAPDIRELIRKEAGGDPDGEGEPFDDDRIR